MPKKKQNNKKNIIQNNASMGSSSSFLPFTAGSAISAVLCGANSSPYLTNQPIAVANIWQKNWIAKAIVEIPVQDAFKEPPAVKTDLVSEEECLAVIKDFKNNFYSKLLYFFYQVRAFGTAFLILIPRGFKDGNVSTTNFSVALTTKEIINAKEIECIIASPYEMFDLTASRNYYNLNDDATLNEECPYWFQGQKIHHTRVIKMITSEPPLPIKNFLYTNGGLSILENVTRELEQNEIMKQLALTMTNEAKIDIFLKSGYDDSVAEGQEAMMKTQLQNAMQNKNFNTTLVIDKNTTDYQQKQLNLANLDSLMIAFERSCFVATGIPMKRLGVLSSNGFSDSDKTTEQNYNKTLTFVRNWGKSAIAMLYKVSFLRTLQYIPSDFEIEFESLDVLNEAEKQALKNQNLDNLLKLNDKIEISQDCLIDAINDFEIFSKKVNFKTGGNMNGV
jgi:phage-related protein (TIGR01555 family)